MTWNARLRGIGLAAALLAAVWAAAGQAQERAALSLVAAESDGIIVEWTWPRDGPDSFAVHWRPRASGAEWVSAEIAGSARRYAITRLRPLSAYIVRVRALDAGGNRVRADDGRPRDLRGVFDTTRSAAPVVAFDGERATVSWDAVKGAARYELEWGTANGDAAVEQLGADARAFTTEILAAGVQYEFRVRAFNDAGNSAFSEAAELMPTAWPNAVPSAQFEFEWAAGMLVEWEAVAGVGGYVVGWEREGDASRGGEVEATGTSALVTREGGFFTGSWLLRVRAVGGGLWSEAARVWVKSPAPELRFSLESSRELCTEGTLTEIRWRGGGGGGNLRPHVNGRMIGENTYRVKVNCGMIPRGEDGEIDESRRDAVITGFLRDGRGVVRSASIRVVRAEALPALISDGGAGHVMHGFSQGWKRSEAGASAANGKREMLVMMRWKRPDENRWEYSTTREGLHQVSFDVQFDKPTERVFVQAAELREVIEAETPEALGWSEMIDYRLQTAPKNLRAVVTHDTLTIEWDAQLFSDPSTEYPVSITGPDGIIGVVVPAEPVSSGEPNRVVFSSLPPNTEFTIRVDTTRNVEAGLISHIIVRTKPAPDGYMPVLRGSQNLTATATRSSVRLEWSPPFKGAAEVYVVALRDDTGEFVAGDVLWAIPETGASFTFRGLRSGTIYSASVSHRGIVEASAVLTVTTLASACDFSGAGSLDFCNGNIW